MYEITDNNGQTEYTELHINTINTAAAIFVAYYAPEIIKELVVPLDIFINELKDLFNYSPQPMPNYGF